MRVIGNCLTRANFHVLLQRQLFISEWKIWSYEKVNYVIGNTRKLENFDLSWNLGVHFNKTGQIGEKKESVEFLWIGCLELKNSLEMLKHVFWKLYFWVYPYTLWIHGVLTSKLACISWDTLAWFALYFQCP